MKICPEHDFEGKLLPHDWSRQVNAIVMRNRDGTLACPKCEENFANHPQLDSINKPLGVDVKDAQFEEWFKSGDTEKGEIERARVINQFDWIDFKYTK